MKSIATVVFIFLVNLVFTQEKPYLKIDSIINIKVQDNHPGIAIGIVKDGKITYEKYAGLANLQHQVNFDEKTRSNIASTAKQYTALMILQLSLEGKISLEDDVRKYLTKLYPKVKEEIKIRHLLNHTSGIRDYVELLDLEGDVWWKRFKFSNDDILNLIENQNDLGFTPGTKHSYSNTNYNLLAKVIEKVSGQTFNEYSKAFFEKLGMNETSFIERYMKVIPNRANPYSDWGRGEWWEVPTVTKTNGEGFLFTTLKDQLIYEIAIQNATRNNNFLLIKSQQPIPNSQIKTYGFGLELEDRFSRKAVHHSGGTYGFNSQVYRFPEEKLTIFAMSNNGNISTNFIAQKIARILLPKKDTQPKYAKQYFESTNNEKPIILGKYTYPNENSMVQILKNEGKFYWKEKNFTIEIKAEAKNDYSFTNDKNLKIRFYDGKMVEYYSSGKVKTYTKRKEEPASISDLEGLVGNYTNEELAIDFDLTLTKENNLEFKLSSNKGSNDVIVYNKTYLLADNYFLKVEKDKFDRAVAIYMNFGRALNIKFTKKTNLQYQPKTPTENGSIQVTTIGSKKGETTDILLTKNDSKGNEIWLKRLGGKSYDKASSILATKDGYLIVGSTSSYGVGNYDMYVIKTNKEGKQLWQKTYGKFNNDYGYSAEKVKQGFIIKGTTQLCNSKDVLHRKCATNVWFVTIDEKGNEISNKILEEIK